MLQPCLESGFFDRSMERRLKNWTNNHLTTWLKLSLVTPSCKIRLLILANFFNLSLLPEKSLNQLALMFSFTPATLTGGSLVWAFLWLTLAKSLGAGEELEESEGQCDLLLLNFY